MIVRSWTTMCLGDLSSLGFTELPGSMSYCFCFYQMCKIFNQYFFKYYFSHIISLLTNYMCVWLLDIISQVIEALFIFHFLSFYALVELSLFTFLQIQFSYCVQYAINHILWIYNFTYCIFHFYNSHLILF